MREIRLYGSEGGEFSPRPLSSMSRYVRAMLGFGGASPPTYGCSAKNRVKSP